MLKIVPIVFFLFLFLVTVPAFAQENNTQQNDTQIDVRGSIVGFFDSIRDFAQAQTNSSTWFDPEKKDEINKVTDSGVKTGVTAFELWFSFHEFIVDAIFAGSPVPFDRGIIVLVSFVIGTILVFKIFWSFFKRIWKIVLAIFVIIGIILVSGIQFPSIT